MNLEYLKDGPLQISKFLVRFLNGSFDLGDEIMKRQIHNFHQSLIKDTNPERYQVLIKKNFHEMVVYMLESYSKQGNVDLIYSVLSLLVSLTNNSKEFCQALLNTNLPDVLIKHSIRNSNENIQIYLKFINLRLSIIFNIIRIAKFRKPFLNNVNIVLFKKTLTKFSSLTEDLRLVAMLVLGCLTMNNDEYEISHLKDSNIINIILRFISFANLSRNRNYNGFDVWELLLGLESLSTLAPLQEQMTSNEDLIDILLKIMLSTVSKPKEVKVVLKILKNLCVHKKIRHLFNTKYKMNSVVKSFNESCDVKLKKISKELLYKLRESQENTDYNRNLKYDIFINYSEDDSDAMFKVIQLLKKTFKVYTSTDNGHENKNIIKRSDIVIIGISCSYQNNKRCKSEVEYAFGENKCIISLILTHKFRPYGWLKEIVNMKRCIDFSDNSLFKQSFCQLLPFIKESHVKDFKSTESLSSIPSDNKDISKKAQLPVDCASLKEMKIENLECEKIVFNKWSQDEVSEWLTRNKLSEVLNKFNEFDGEMLEAVLKMKTTAKKTYYDHLSVSLGLSFTEILRFDCALDKFNY